MTSGAVLFVRYALAPNRLGYCGPADSDMFFQYGVHGRVDPGFGRLARQFEGAWPQLSLIAASTGTSEPLDREVVEAYWVGNRLLDRIRVGADEEGLPHHSHQVFRVYPWAALLPDERTQAQALRVLDQCRIRWGQVVADLGAEVVVSSRPLVWNGYNLELGRLRQETVARGIDGVSLVGRLQPGEWVSLHWDWICDRLTAEQVAALRRYSAHNLRLANRDLATEVRDVSDGSASRGYPARG
ncbi:DUF6390 family protein [Kribbella sp. NPDC004875]|uniref:DUF6390 family protein n=1 Tax=Kribbella sp. NPDC004875 TaxID=3364107 RepID=UPI00369764FA